MSHPRPDLIPGQWYKPEFALPLVDTLCVIDLGAHELYVAVLQDNPDYETPEDDDDDDEDNPFHWVTPDGDNTYEAVAEVMRFLILPE